MEKQGGKSIEKFPEAEKKKEYKFFLKPDNKEISYTCSGAKGST